MPNNKVSQIMYL